MCSLAPSFRGTRVGAAAGTGSGQAEEGGKGFCISARQPLRPAILPFAYSSHFQSFPSGSLSGVVKFVFESLFCRTVAYLPPSVVSSI